MPGSLGDLTKTTLLIVGTLFPIVNPIGNTPIFLSLTRGLTPRGRTTLARMVAVNGLILILTSIFIGSHILAFFGISLPVVQVGGGLIVISTGWTSYANQATMRTARMVIASVTSLITPVRHSIP